MNNMMNNKGLINYGGTQNVTDSAIGESIIIGRSPRHQNRAAAEAHGTWGIGVVTVLPEEANAVLTELGLTEDETRTRAQRFYTGHVKVLGGAVDVVATQASGQGQRATMTALNNLQRHYDPAVLVLVGIGGAIHHAIAINDVVVATRVVYYDLRKVTFRGTQRRSEERESPHWMVQRVNSFFTHHGGPAVLRVTESGRKSAPFRVFSSPIGSGEAVIADPNSEIRNFLNSYHDKILAVDMESGGLSQFCHGSSTASGATPGWAVIRGISDYADHAKNDNWHPSAARNAAHTLHRLIPYIHTGA